MSLDKQQILNWINECNLTFARERDHLTQLDADIGDADHGLNMNRGFERVAEKLPAVAEQSMSTLLKTVGMTLLSSVGGASGPLYGTFFIRAASAVDGKESLSATDFAKLLGAGVDGVVARGKAQPGDKTMCDLWWPVVEAANQAAEQGKSISQMLPQLTEIADEAVVSTIGMRAKKGRASYLGERSVGHQDPGATSSMMMVHALNQVVQGS
ncbi:dihydroxyacetone kinase subunit DhaL [Dongshaea marina]|uniref:dihydroxyacetone kinase subunit DhaL n=1 Tax=Dongshaea marina TaxID=2047966 RepID=UPI000D3E2A8B|nr:dihydroxyacetone kinase subunit DhaL [Dongshaea marina]